MSFFSFSFSLFILVTRIHLRNLNNDAPLKAPTTPPFLFTDLFWSSWSMPICSFPSFFRFFCFSQRPRVRKKFPERISSRKRGEKKTQPLLPRKALDTSERRDAGNKKQALSPHLDVLGRLGEAERVEAAVAGERAVEPRGPLDVGQPERLAAATGGGPPRGGLLGGGRDLGLLLEDVGGNVAVGGAGAAGERGGVLKRKGLGRKDRGLFF